MLFNHCFHNWNTIRFIEWLFLRSHEIHQMRPNAPEGGTLLWCGCMFVYVPGFLETLVMWQESRLSLLPSCCCDICRTWLDIIATILCEQVRSDTRQLHRDPDTGTRTHLSGSFKGAVDTLNPDCSSNSTHHIPQSSVKRNSVLPSITEAFAMNLLRPTLLIANGTLQTNDVASPKHLWIVPWSLGFIASVLH